ncbi:hypothetical protein GUITHDRAFT_137142 [Guillardia theta CCMP2712]|uniref:Uncharacterized protein n=2 Tax=Guillardia theta TaxID=55529 RepID=L1JHX7_GUITC|nr:hypothetical protein GUITHDRAFT_137142 [Guillardia theta CCMP2712]EKX47749.1 hypothetical protein GUITHDRAFT_137142 [Guillardia theta CCMP2712]|eukprot:XP_005834729.1 hypothetical protein GUITHDRAFT_137142 [Guillardia theta CCMP2712]
MAHSARKSIALVALLVANDCPALAFRYAPLGAQHSLATMSFRCQGSVVARSPLKLPETRSVSRVRMGGSRQGDVTFESLQESLPPLMLNVMFGLSAVALAGMVLNGYSLSPLGTFIVTCLHALSVVPNYLLRAGKRFPEARIFTLEDKEFVYPSIQTRLCCTVLQWFFNRFVVLFYELLWVFRSSRFFHQSVMGLKYINAQTGRDVGWKRMFFGVFVLGHFGPFLAGGLAGGLFGLISAIAAPAGSQGVIAEMVYFGKAGSILLALLLSVLNILHAFWDDKNRFYMDKISSTILVYDELNINRSD